MACESRTFIVRSTAAWRSSAHSEVKAALATSYFLFPTSCSCLPDFAENLAANTFAARLTTCHHTLPRSHDRDTKTALDALDLVLADVHAAAGTRNALQIADRRLIIRAILQVHTQHLLTILFGGLVVGDITLLFQDAGNLRLQLGGRGVELLMAGAVG